MFLKRYKPKTIHFVSTNTLSNEPNLKSFYDIPGPKTYPLIGSAPSLKMFGEAPENFFLNKLEWRLILRRLS